MRSPTKELPDLKLVWMTVSDVQALVLLINAIQWINLYPVDNAVGIYNTHPLESDLSGGIRHRTVEQLGSEL